MHIRRSVSMPPFKSTIESGRQSQPSLTSSRTFSDQPVGQSASNTPWFAQRGRSQNVSGLPLTRSVSEAPRGMGKEVLYEEIAEMNEIVGELSQQLDHTSQQLNHASDQLKQIKSEKTTLEESIDAARKKRKACAIKLKNVRKNQKNQIIEQDEYIAEQERYIQQQDQHIDELALNAQHLNKTIFQLGHTINALLFQKGNLEHKLDQKMKNVSSQAEVIKNIKTERTREIKQAEERHQAVLDEKDKHIIELRKQLKAEQQASKDLKTENSILKRLTKEYRERLEQKEASWKEEMSRVMGGYHTTILWAQAVQQHASDIPPATMAKLAQYVESNLLKDMLREMNDIMGKVDKKSDAEALKDFERANALPAALAEVESPTSRLSISDNQPSSSSTSEKKG